MEKRTYEWILPFFFTGGLIIARYLFPSKMTFITEVALYTLYVMGNNILFGYLGYVSFGQPVYPSMGAYSAAIYLAYQGRNPLVAILVAILMGVLVGYSTTKEINTATDCRKAGKDECLVIGCRVRIEY